MTPATIAKIIARPGPARAILRLAGDDLQQAKSDLAAAQYDLAKAEQESRALEAQAAAIQAAQKNKADKIEGLSLKWVGLGAGALLLLWLLPGGR